MKKIAKGQCEAKISEAMIKFEKEFMGRWPTETVAYIREDVIFVRLKGVLTPAEEQLAKVSEGANLIKEVRGQLLEGASTLLTNIITEVLGCRIISLHSDISTNTGERIIVFVVDNDLENKFI